MNNCDAKYGHYVMSEYPYIHHPNYLLFNKITIYKIIIITYKNIIYQKNIINIIYFIIIHACKCDFSSKIFE